MRLMEILIFIALLFSIGVLKKTGHSLKEILSLLSTGKNKALIMIQVFILLGILTTVWMASGTIPYLVKIGIEVIRPELFVVCTFLLCTAMSFLTGSSFGTANIFGIVFITMAKSSGVDLSLTVGAILSGVYVGDRCSPMSSVLLLLSTVTESEHYANVKMACQTSVIPVILSAGLYLSFSAFYPMKGAPVSLLRDIEAVFSMNPIVLLPVILLLCLCLMKIAVKRAIICSIIAGTGVIFLTQPMTFFSFFKLLIFGYYPQSGTSIDALINGGGIISMLDVSIIVFFACMLAEAIDRIWQLRPKTVVQEGQVEKSRLYRFLHTSIVALIVSVIGCNQVMPIILTSAIEKENYKALGQSALIKDVSIAAILIPSLVPWNLSVLGVLAILGVSGLGHLPYIFFIYIMLIAAVLSNSNIFKKLRKDKILEALSPNHHKKDRCP